jgi:DNA-binding MarR family transcriptional regulator
MPVNRPTRRLPASPDQLLTGKLVLLGHLLRQSASAIYRRQLGLGQEEWRIVARLGSTESVPLNELGRRTGLRKSQISRAITRLMRKALLSRSIGEEDAREARLHLTARGRSVHRAIVRTAAKRSEYLARGTGAARLERLHADLDRLLERAAELVKQSG